MTLTKSWVNGSAGDTATLTISGAQVSGAVGGSSTAPSTTTNATATASVGSTVNLAETLGGGNVGSYTASLACTANGSPLTVTNNTITMPNAAVTRFRGHISSEEEDGVHDAQDTPTIFS